MDEYKTDYLEAAAEEAERFREAAMILAERAGGHISGRSHIPHSRSCAGHTGRNHVHCGRADKRS